MTSRPIISKSALFALSLAAALIIGDGGRAQAAHAFTLVATTNHSMIFVDLSSITKDGGKRKAWSLLVFDPPRKATNGAYAYELEQDLNACDTHRRALADIIQFDENGNVLNKGRPPTPEYESVDPNTIGESIHNAVCSGKSDLNRAPSFTGAEQAATMALRVMKASHALSK